jgi:hypothetical protein
MSGDHHDADIAPTKTRVFYDTEFREDGHTIDLLSIGIVRESGESYYAVVSDADWDAVRKDQWLVENVWPGMPTRGLKTKLVTIGGRTESRVDHAGVLDTTSSLVKPKWVIANEVRDFLTETPGLELWAWYAAYDHVALAQLWGRMIRLPKGIPMWTNDLRQEAERLGNPPLPEQEGGVHNALADARHNLVRAQALGLVERPYTPVQDEGGDS